MKIKLFLNKINKYIKGVMSSATEKINQQITMTKLKTKAKIKKAFKTQVIQELLSTDITFIFLFLALYLWGYDWNWQLMIACVGAWVVLKEIFKEIGRVAREISR